VDRAHPERTNLDHRQLLDLSTSTYPWISRLAMVQAGRPQSSTSWTHRQEVAVAFMVKVSCYGQSVRALVGQVQLLPVSSFVTSLKMPGEK
jgi:hypothetical protein